MVRFGVKAVVATLGSLALAGCGSSGGGASFTDMFLSGGIGPAPVQNVVSREHLLPHGHSFEGGSSIQVYAGGRTGDPSALRSQVALGELARECELQADGSVLVKVGVEGRALQGSGGGTGRFDVPVRITIKSGSTVLAERSRRTAVVIPPGNTQASFAIVEDAIVVPAQASQEFEIEVGLGGSSPAQGARRRRG